MTQAIQQVKVEDVQEAPWNVNVMDEATFQTLVSDMKNVGPEGTGPIHTASRTVTGYTGVFPGRVTIDGSHRLRAAKKLGWSYLLEIFHPEVETEEQARLFNYRMDAERGNIDPFKLAATFSWFAGKGVSQEQIAAKFSIDRSTVSRRLSLLELDPDVKKHLVARNFTASHLEPISTLDPTSQRDIQKEMTRDWAYDKAAPSVRRVESRVQQLKEELEEEKKWQEAVKSAKFKTCPKCTQPARRSYLAPPRVQCGGGHTWNMNTGKDPYEDKVWSERDQRTLKRSDANLPQHFKTARTVAEFSAANFGFFQHLFPNMENLTHATLNGQLKNGKTFRLRFENMSDYGTQFEYETANESRLHFYTQKAGGQWVKKGLKTRVTGPGRVTKKEHLKTWEEAASKFLEEYLPRGTRKGAAK